MLWNLIVTQATPNNSDYGPNVSLYQIEILFVIVGVEYIQSRHACTSDNLGSTRSQIVHYIETNSFIFYKIV